MSYCDKEGVLAIDFKKLIKKVENVVPVTYEGKVTKVVGLKVSVEGLKCFIGELCTLYNEYNNPIRCEVVGFEGDEVLLMPLGELKGIGAGCRVVASGKALGVKCSDELLGKIVDALGNPTDGSVITSGEMYDLNNEPPDPMSRERIKNIMPTGVRALDGFLTCGEGQRFAIMAGTGVGKSTLMGMIARTAQADVNVICLIGERGREVKDFIERDIGEEGMKKTVIVYATSDKEPLVRSKGALTATSIAEYFRDKGKKVILMMDSVTRFAMAKREIGLSLGEPPAQKSYPPSVFAELPKLLERSGMGEKGSITAFYTTLVEGDNMNDPIGDAVRGIVDGHIVLSRKLANEGHFPAIDVNASISRLMNDIATTEHKAMATDCRDMLTTYNDSVMLVKMGKYIQGSDIKVDRAMSKIGDIKSYLKQGVDECTTFEDALKGLEDITK